MKVLVLAADTDLPEAHLLAGLKDRGVEMKIMGSLSPRHRDVVSAHGISVESMGCRGRIDLFAIATIRSELLAGRYDIMHSLSSRSLSNGLLASRGFPIKHVAYRGTSGHLSRWDPASWLTYFHPRLDKIICVSDAVRAYLVGKKISPSKLVTIYKGHDPKWYESGIPASLSQFGIPQDSFVVTTSANMRKVKGIDVLLDAFSLIKHHNIHFLLIGEVRDKSIARRQALLEATGKVHFAGYRKDSISLVRSSQVFVMPSISREGLPKALLEAMSVGVPAIVTNVGGMPEVVTDRVHGLVVPPSSPAAIAEAVDYLASHEDIRKSMAERSKERLANEFTIEKTIEQTLAVYTSLLN